MALTWQQFIDTENSLKVYLARLRPYQEYTGWTLVSGTLYKKSITQKIVHVRFDRENMALGSSETTLNPGEWFYKDSTSELFVELTGGADPAAGNVYGYYYLFFSTHYNRLMGDPDDNYWNELIEGVPAIERGRDGTLSRDTISFGELAIKNGGGFFNSLWNTVFLDQIQLELFVTGYVLQPITNTEDWLPWASKKQIFKGLAARARYTDALVTFSVADFLDLLFIDFPLAQYDTTTWPNLDPNVVGQPIHRGYGILRGIEAVQIDTTTFKYKFDDQGVTSIQAVYDETGATLARASDNLPAGETTLTAATTKRVFVDYTKNIGSTPFNRPGEIKKEILTNVLKIADADIDTAAYDTLDTARPYALGVSVPEIVPVSEIFDLINRSVLAEENTDRLGKITTQKKAKPAAGDPNQQVYDDTLNILPPIEFAATIENLADAVLVGYDRDYSKSEADGFKFVTGDAVANDYESINITTIPTALTKSADAAAIAAAYKPFIDKPELSVNFNTPLKCFDQKVGDTFTYSRPAGKGPTGLGAYWKISRMRENFVANITELTGVQ